MTIDSGQWTIFVAAALLFLLYRKFLHPAVDESAVQMLIFKRRENAPTGAFYSSGSRSSVMSMTAFSFFLRLTRDMISEAMQALRITPTPM